MSNELGIGQRTISTTIYQYENFKTISSPNRKKNRENIFTKIDDFDKNAIRRTIHGFWFEKQIPTLDKILSRINTTEGLPQFTRTTLYSLLRQMGFKYQRRSRNSAMTERDEIVVWRRNYLEDIKRYREEGRPIYYMDETWVNAGDCNSRIWVDKTVISRTDAFSKGLSTGPTNPSGKGKRLIVVHIGNEDGFVPGGLLCFESKKNTKDYHDEMNGEVFFEWLESVLPRLKDNAVIVMDNAPYHSVKIDKAPTSGTKKADIIKWLQDKGEVIDKPMVISQLMTIVRRIKHLHDKYVIDEYVKQYNKDVLRLPPYHCELNPIEMAWSAVKNHVKTNNTTYKLPDVRRLLEEGLDKVNDVMWKNFIRHVMGVENKFWDMDFMIDEMLAEKEPMVVTYTDETSDESDDDI